MEILEWLLEKRSEQEGDLRFNPLWRLHLSDHPLHTDINSTRYEKTVLASACYTSRNNLKVVKCCRCNEKIIKALLKNGIKVHNSS